ncbi:MAG: YjjG family noncanonical pyrimidine nucleotidase, partial [Owenweeksia sp.]
WDKYRQGEIDKATLRTQRFSKTLLVFGHNDSELGSKLDMEYLEISPHQTALIPDTLEVLEYLAPRYELHILTNGFTEIQDIKLTKSGLKPFFRHIITSESVGVNKPHIRVFEESLKRTGARKNHSIMIGDNLGADIVGARNCGMDQVYFNPAEIPHKEEVTFEIRKLKELLRIL